MLQQHMQRRAKLRHELSKVDLVNQLDLPTVHVLQVDLPTVHVLQDPSLHDKLFRQAQADSENDRLIGSGGWVAKFVARPQALGPHATM